MMTFKRQRRRNYQRQYTLYQYAGLGAAFVVLVAMLLWANAAKNNAENLLHQSREMMADSIQNDMNQALKNYDLISRRNADVGGEVLPSMRRHMYAANTMNRLLTQTFGEDYSLLDGTLYADFDALIDNYASLLAMGQSTTEVQNNLMLCMNNVSQALSNRFGDDGTLLPKTASQSQAP